MCLEVGRITIGQIRATGVPRNRQPSVQILFPATQSISAAEPARGLSEWAQQAGWYQKDFATAVSSRGMVYSHVPECLQKLGLARCIPDSRLGTDPCNPLCWELSSPVTPSHWGF